MPINDEMFKAAMRRFASGVTVVTARAVDGRPQGVTVSAFSSLSLSPPLVLVCLDRATNALDAYVSGEFFAVNILADGQSGVSDDFAYPGPVSPFERHPWRDGETSVPLLAGTLAGIECRRHAVQDGGDHVILIGRVEHAHVSPDGSPLLYTAGAYGRFAPGTGT